MREIWKYFDYMKKATAMFSRLTSNNIFSLEKSLAFYVVWFMPFVVGLRVHDYKEYREFVEGRGFELYDTFFDIRLKNRGRYFGELINDYEVYNESHMYTIEEDVKIVSLKSKFKQLYECMFDISKSKDVFQIGSITINSEVRKEFRNIINGISYLADYK